MDASQLLMTLGAEALARAAMLAPVIVGVVSTIKTVAAAGKWTDLGNAFAPVLALLLGVLLNVLLSYAIAETEPVNVAMAILVGFIAGASASVAFKIVKSVPEMKAAVVALKAS